MKKRVWICVALCALLVWAAVPSLAEDCFTIDVDALDMNSLNSDDYVAQYLSASAQGVRVKKYISNSSELAAPVRLTLMQMDSQTLLFDKDYGLQSGTFDSGVIYLPYVADRTIPYLVTLTIGDYVYAMPFMHQQARLIANNACTYGVRLNDLAVAFYGPIHLYAQRWLFRGPLSEERKAAFRQAAYRHVQRFFQERGTDAWQPS